MSCKNLFLRVGFCFGSRLVALGVIAFLLNLPLVLARDPLAEKDPVKEAQAKQNLPEGFEREPHSRIETVDGIALYARIAYVLKDGTRIPFNLVPRKTPSDPPTFYIMQNKVSNELFGKLGVAGPKSVWQLGGLAGGKDLGNGNSQVAVFRITVAEAHAFAKALGGRLPSAQEWDKAAGRYDSKGKGPFREPLPDKPGCIGVNRAREGPMEVGKATHDVSIFGCHDMAGNGREFTRTVALQEGREVPLQRPSKDTMVLLRGRSYAMRRPLSLHELERDAYTECQSCTEPSPYTGFRVVLEAMRTK
jgi:hypothetical protein